MGQFAFLAEGDEGLDAVADREEWCAEEEAAGFDGGEVGGGGPGVDLAYGLVEGGLVVQEGEHVDEVDAGHREIGVMLDDGF